MIPTEQHIADLGARTEAARQRWLELAATAREHYAKRVPAEEIAPALEAVDQAERVYRDLHAQWLEARLANDATPGR
jgi:hypothetical protein